MAEAEQVKKTASKYYSTSILPSFTFIVDGPDASVKMSNEDTKYRNKSKSENQSQRQQTKPQRTTVTTRAVPPGPLHIVPSWQPLDANDKPPYSYATLIGHAILSSEHRRLTLSDIYQWITQHYPFYSMHEHGWQNSIRHNLSLNKAFIRIQRSSAANGKGSYWTIRAGQEQVFIDNLIKRRGPIRKQPVTLPRTLHQRRSSHRLGVNEEQQSSSSDYTRHINTSPLFTTFRMTPSPSTPASVKAKRSLPELHRVNCQQSEQQQKQYRREQKQRRHPQQQWQSADDDHDSDCDSGVDVGRDLPTEAFPKSQLKKAKSSPCLYDGYSSFTKRDQNLDFALQDLLPIIETTMPMEATPQPQWRTDIGPVSAASISASTATVDAVTSLSSLSSSSLLISEDTFQEWEQQQKRSLLTTANYAMPSSCTAMSYQHLLASVHIDPLSSSVSSPSSMMTDDDMHPFQYQAPLDNSNSPHNTYGLLPFQDYLFNDNLLMNEWAPFVL